MECCLGRHIINQSFAPSFRQTRIKYITPLPAYNHYIWMLLKKWNHKLTKATKQEKDTYQPEIHASVIMWSWNSRRVENKLIVIASPKPDDGKNSNGDHEYETYKRRNNSSTSTVTVTLEFVTNFVPVSMRIAIPAKLPHERCCTCSRCDGCHIHLRI